jgi:dynein heavy chain
VAQLELWLQESEAGYGVLPCTWISGLFNPMSFLTAIKQVGSRRNKWELNKVIISAEATRKHADEITVPSRDGAFIHGLYLEGAGWDWTSASLIESLPNQLSTIMPVLLLKARIDAKKPNSEMYYNCPVYMSANRGPTFILSVLLRTKSAASYWILRGVALLTAAD